MRSLERNEKDMYIYAERFVTDIDPDLNHIMYHADSLKDAVEYFKKRLLETVGDEASSKERQMIKNFPDSIGKSPYTADCFSMWAGGKDGRLPFGARVYGDKGQFIFVLAKADPLPGKEG